MRIVGQREWSWVCENDRESARMKKSLLWERWLYFTSTWRIVSLREWSWVNDNDSQSLIFLFWKSVSSSWWRMKTLSTSQLCRSSCSSLRHISIVDLLSARRHRMISTILIFLSVETSLDKEKNRSHTHTSNHLSLTNKSTLKTSNKKILSFASLRLF